ncbi:phosphopantetheine-containing protein [Xenococcus sp. PCC 7305]|uniref:acyl carrier protein n=1 Tax=Xenococcus sp. PCC 7305 TaxID=102125 RepID=UPI0002ABF6AC|nr:phosphopantetheine-binding protein [Xenococcus sp. PCC 7305]ELS03905.1 phosphopantetheine-containing protein [Xenococcus sp. PCC 7305]
MSNLTISDTIVSQLKEIMASELDLNLKVEEIDENANLLESDMGVDSLAIVELIYLVEEHFKIEFIDDELTPENFETLNILANIVSSKQKNN